MEQIIYRCKTCAFSKPEYLTKTGDPDKRYKRDRYCSFHKRHTTIDGFCHWHQTRWWKEDEDGTEST